MTPPLWLLDVDGVVNAVGWPPDTADVRAGGADGPGVVDDRADRPSTNRPRADRPAEWAQGSAQADGRWWPIRWSPRVVAEIRRLHQSGVVEVAWLTTWGADANKSLRELLDLPELAVAGTRPRPGEPPATPLRSAAATHADATGAAAADHDTGRWWKLDVVRAQIAAEPERPLVWTDDDLVWEPEVVRGLRAFADCLLIAPDPTVGLTLGDLVAIEAYCRRASR